MNSAWTRLLAVAAVLFAAGPSAAANFPSKPITVVIGYPAGGPTDVLMRAIAPRLSKGWGQPVIVDNKPGANESIAAQWVARAPADGHTLLLSTEMPLTMNQFLFKKLSYNPERDFTSITGLLSSPLVLVVPPSLPVNSLQDFIDLARNRSASRPLTYGSSGVGSVIHLPMTMLANEHGLEFTHVPYKGVAPLVTDLVAGQIEAAWVGVSGAAPYVKDGRLKALVVDAPSRVKALSQVPVFSETAVSRVQADFIFALVAPAGTPLPVRETISAAVRHVLDDPDFRQVNTEPFGYVIHGSTPADLDRYLAKDRRQQAERIRVSGAQLD